MDDATSSFPTRQPGETKAAQIKEYDRVRLAEEVLAEGHVLPKGAEGTVVLRHSRGEAFEVEFTTPFHSVVGVPSSLLLPTD